MTRFDIRVRRNQFTQSRIDSHKNFQNLIGNYDVSSRKKTKGVILVVGLLILIIAIMLAYFASDEPKKNAPEQKVPNESVSLNIKIKNITVYKL